MILPGKETREKQQHSTAYKPYSFYECWIPRYFSNVPMHWHSEFEINLIVRGTGEFICGSEHVTLSEGGLLFLPPNMLHAAYPYQNQELRYYAMVFSPALLGTGSQDRCTLEYIRPLMSGACQVSPVIPPSAANYSQLKASAERIFDCVLDKYPQPELLLKSELLRFVWLLETDAGILRQKGEENRFGEQVRPALEYMLHHYQENISIEQLARMTHLSKSYFMNCFKKGVGISAARYLSHIRINAACEALSSTEKKVSEIAFCCGYGNLSNFNRQFKEIMGCSPHEYRRQNGNWPDA